ncbi:ACT domain-containing protein [Thalassotalea ponticola]|uniref:glycine cleavage system protein R n=1 Tax=Thalassotalea ponticola TaxID=1523392 RepID=UPI0025B3FBCD|nr:ACT domain-containing protein [Thalassotalea ponticola]MDN3653033.1 ACT domain-containing protein [Thalassotalea ponticola]
MSEYLVFTAIGSDRTGIVSEITQLVSTFGCNIDDSRMAIWGEEFSLIMLVSGSKSAINQLEVRLPLLAQSLQLLTVCKRTQANDKYRIHQCLQATFRAPNAPGLLHKVTQFFAEKGIDLSSLKTLPDEESNEVAIHMLINLPKHIDKEVLIDQFQQLCRLLNVYGQISPPQKHIF